MTIQICNLLWLEVISRGLDGYASFEADALKA